MAVIMMVSFNWIKYMEKANMYGRIQNHISGNGSIIKCMEKESLHGKMVKVTQACSNKTWDTVMESLYGVMEDHTKETGIMVSKMELVYLQILKTS